VRVVLGEGKGRTARGWGIPFGRVGSGLEVVLGVVAALGIVPEVVLESTEGVGTLIGGKPPAMGSARAAIAAAARTKKMEA
jgi:hypothetical protein